jgi:tetratricopeptide (TPR) repeat protein
MKKWLKAPVLFLCLLVAAFGCARLTAKCVSPEDTPTHQYLQGMKLLEDNKVDEASAKFERALYCNDEFAHGYAGAAVAGAVKIASTPGGAQADTDNVYQNLKYAFKYSVSKEDEFAAYVASMRVYTSLKPPKWLPKAEDDYRNAMKLKVDEKKLLYYEGREGATYFMGVAYLEAGDLEPARDMFSNVLSGRSDSKWNGPADRYWKKIVR